MMNRREETRTMRRLETAQGSERSISASLVRVAVERQAAAGESRPAQSRQAVC